MLPAVRRLRTAADFQNTTRRGTKVSRGCVVLYVRRSTEDHPARCGIVTSKSIGGSVARHRTARRIRAVVADLLPGLPAGTDVVVRALPGADRATSLRGDIEAALAGALR